MQSRTEIYSKNIHTSDGHLNFFATKSYSKRALNDEFDIESNLNGYNISIYLTKKKYYNENGLIQMNFSPQIQFNGSLIEFDFENLSKNESTVILSGTLNILGNKKQKSFLGNIKQVENTIYISSNFILDISEYNFDKVFNCSSINSSKSIRIELALQLK